jgi:hypothetical protein
MRRLALVVVAALGSFAAGCNPALELEPPAKFPAPLEPPRCDPKGSQSPAEVAAVRASVGRAFADHVALNVRWNQEAAALGAELGVPGADLPLALATLDAELHALYDLSACRPTYEEHPTIAFRLACPRPSAQIAARRDRVVAAVTRHFPAFAALSAERKRARDAENKGAKSHYVSAADYRECYVPMLDFREMAFDIRGPFIASGRAIATCSYSNVVTCFPSCTAGDAESCGFLALAYHMGTNGLAKDESAATGYSERACTLSAEDGRADGGQCTMAIVSLGTTGANAGTMDLPRARALLTSVCGAGPATESCVAVSTMSSVSTDPDLKASARAAVATACTKGAARACDWQARFP